MSITVYGENEKTFLHKAKERASELENLWSVTDENSEIFAVSHSERENVHVSPETAELLDFSINISEMTDGALDCTMYPVLTEWDFTTCDYKIPTDLLDLGVNIQTIGTKSDETDWKLGLR